MDFRANLSNFKMFSIYFIYNLIAKKEVSKRQGLPLGDRE
jgi:hypothetical protein